MWRATSIAPTCAWPSSIAALSLGIDLGFGQPMEHVLRQSLIALRLAERVGLDEDERAVVYYTALLISVGCHSDAHEQAKWFGDDIALKAGKFDHEPRSLRMATPGMRNLGAGRPPLHRFRLGLEFALSGHRDVDGMIEPMPPSRGRWASSSSSRPEVAEALGAAYEMWDGKGWPGELAGEAVPIASRLAHAGGVRRGRPPRGRGRRGRGRWPASAAAGSSIPCWPTSARRRRDGARRPRHASAPGTR